VRDQQLGRFLQRVAAEHDGEMPRRVMIARHSPQSLARFHPLASYAEWERRYREVVADLRAADVPMTEIDADAAPASITTSQQLASWCERQRGDGARPPYRLGIKWATGSKAPFGKLGFAGTSQSQIGWCITGLRSFESGEER